MEFYLLKNVAQPVTWLEYVWVLGQTLYFKDYNYSKIKVTEQWKTCLWLTDNKTWGNGLITKDNLQSIATSIAHIYTVIKRLSFAIQGWKWHICG